MSIEIKPTPGAHIGYWQILAKRDNHQYLCRCICGKEQVVPESYLLSGVINSCGCKHNRTIDLTGKKFGRLTAIEPLPERSADSNVLWLCQCECGNQKVFKAALLTSGRRKSCGCMGVRTDMLLSSRTFVEGTCVEYMFSDHTPKNNTSGRKGVNFDRGKWRASITYGGKTRWLGSFDNFEDAVQARKTAEDEVREHLREVIRASGTEISEEQLQKNLKDKDPAYIKPRGLSANNKTGYLGVTAYGNKWRASFTRNRKTRWLGTFDNIEEAIAARRKAEDEYNAQVRKEKELRGIKKASREVITETQNEQAITEVEPGKQAVGA